LLKVCFYHVIKRHGFVPAVRHKCITRDGFCMGAGCQILLLIPKPNFVFVFIIVLPCRMNYWLLMELAEKMLAAVLGRVTGPGLHLLTSLEAGVEGGCRCPLTAASCFPRYRLCPVPASRCCRCLPAGGTRPAVCPQLPGSPGRFLICSRQNQVDYLQPLIRLSKIIPLAFGVVSFLPEVN